MAGSSMGLETQLLNQFTCNICKSQLREPRALPCLHSFCQECLKGMCGDELFVHTLTCPTCKEEVNVPGGNVSNFPMDFLADRFLSAVLEICPDAHAEGNGAEENADNNTDREKAKNYEMCYGHNKIRDMYCHNCNQVYCMECSCDHVDHAVGTVKDAAMSAVQNMTSLANAARDRHTPLQEAIEEIRQSIEETEVIHDAAIEGLDRSFDDMIRALKHRKKDLLEELNDLRYDRVSVLKMKRNELCATIKKSLELSQTVTEVMEGDTDTNLIYKEEELCDALYRLCNKSYVIVTKDDDAKVDYEFKPKMLAHALESITSVGEIEFHFDEGSEDGEDEEEILYDEEEMAREELARDELAREEVAREEIAREEIEREEKAREEKAREEIAKKEIENYKEVIRSENNEEYREEKTVAENKAVAPEQVVVQDAEVPSASRNVSREGQPTKKEKQKENVAQNNKDAGKEKKDVVNVGKGAAINEEQYKERPTEEEVEEEAKDTVTEDIPRTNTTTSLTSRRAERSATRARESNPCFEVKFTAPDKDTISRYRDISRTPIVELGGKGHEEGQLYYPYGVAITQQDNLLVSDQGNSRIQVLDRISGSCVMCFGEEGNNQGQFNGPSGVTTHEGTHYVSDTGNDRVQVFDRDGNFIRFIGENKLHSPRGITVSGDFIYIANSGMGIISVFDMRTGELVDKIHNKSPHSCDLQLPTGVTSDTDGQIFFTDANNFFCNHFVQVLTSEHRYSRSIGVVGNRPGEFLGPTDLTIDSLGNVIITDTRNHRIQIVDKNNSLVACFGGFGRKKGLLHFPYGVCERNGVLYVSDTNNHRIQVFNSQTS